MTTITAPTTAPTRTRSAAVTDAARRRLFRVSTVAGAAVINAGIFAVARAAGTDFTITDPGEGKIPHTFVAVEIAMVTVVLGLLGWITLAVLERWIRRPQRTWSILAAVIVVLSFVPIGIEQATSSTRIGLAVIHVTVALTLLPLLRKFGSTSQR
jgi:hypothetical protein